MFKKPKRNFRARKTRGSDSEEENNGSEKPKDEVEDDMEIDDGASNTDPFNTAMPKNERPKKKKKSKKTDRDGIPASVLSFGDDIESEGL